MAWWKPSSSGCARPTRDGEWILPIPRGQAEADLVECVYTQLFDGHQFVIYVRL